MAIKVPQIRNTDSGTGWPEDLDIANDGMDLGNAAQISGDLTFDSGGEPRGLPTTPGASDAGASKAYVDSVAVQSRSWKEILLVAEQLLDGASGGVLQAILIAFDSQPTANDTFIITDGTTTETFTFKASESAAFDVAIGATAADTLANLIQAINDDSTLWSGVDTTGLDDYFASAYANQGVIYRTAVSSNDDRVYGSSTTATQIKVVEFVTGGIDDYSSGAGTEGNLPAADPSAKRFGFARTFANLVTVETHPIAEDISTWTWDEDDNLWRQTDSSAITAGAGLDRSGSTISVDLDTTAAETGAGTGGGSSGLEFDTSGNSGELRAAVSATGAIGRQADGLGIRLPSSNPGLQISGNELDAKLDGTRGLAKDASGQYIKIDNSSITFDGSGNLQASGATEAQRIENEMEVNAAVVVADAVEWDGANDRVEPCDADTVGEARVVGIATSAQPTPGSDCTVVSLGVAASVISGATVGDPYFLQTGGGIGPGLPTGSSGDFRRVVRVGYAKNATDLWVEIQDFGRRRIP